MRLPVIVAVLIVASGVASCATRGENTVGGAVAGAGTGAIVGGPVGAVVGAGAGAVVGATVPGQRHYRRYRHHRRYYYR
jgi:hypothetical protein